MHRVGRHRSCEGMTKRWILRSLWRHKTGEQKHGTIDSIGGDELVTDDIAMKDLQPIAYVIQIALF